jgi:hypothetical protein
MLSGKHQADPSFDRWSGRPRGTPPTGTVDLGIIRQLPSGGSCVAFSVARVSGAMVIRVERLMEANKAGKLAATNWVVPSKPADSHALPPRGWWPNAPRIETKCPRSLQPHDPCGLCGSHLRAGRPRREDLLFRAQTLCKAGLSRSCHRLRSANLEIWRWQFLSSLCC